MHDRPHDSILQLFRDCHLTHRWHLQTVTHLFCSLRNNCRDKTHETCSLLSFPRSLADVTAASQWPCQLDVQRHPHLDTKKTKPLVKTWRLSYQVSCYPVFTWSDWAVCPETELPHKLPLSCLLPKRLCLQAVGRLTGRFRNDKWSPASQDHVDGVHLLISVMSHATRHTD